MEQEKAKQLFQQLVIPDKKLSKNPEKDRFISQLLVHIWKDARFTCYSDNGITRT